MKKIQQLVGGQIESAFYLPNEDVCFVDEEGLRKSPLKSWFSFNGTHQRAFVGNALILGTDKETRDSVNVQTPILEIKQNLTFLGNNYDPNFLYIDSWWSEECLKNKEEIENTYQKLEDRMLKNIVDLTIPARDTIRFQLDILMSFISVLSVPPYKFRFHVEDDIKGAATFLGIPFSTVKKEIKRRKKIFS